VSDPYDPNEGWEQLVHGLREECQELSDRLDALEAERDRYREALRDLNEMVLDDRAPGAAYAEWRKAHDALFDDQS
jgi:chromosome segregation ATPase